MNIDEAKKMYFDYNCNEYNMKIDGVLEQFNEYGIPTRVQEEWKTEFINIQFEKLLKEKNLYALNLLSMFARDNTNTHLLMKLYEIYRYANQEQDYFFISKLCCAIINSVNLFHLKNNPSLVIGIIDEMIKEIDIIKDKMDNDKVISKVFEENGTIEQTKKILERYKKTAAKLKSKGM